jgi:hypothetical protein
MLSPYFRRRRLQRAYVFVDWFRDYQEIKEKKRDSSKSSDGNSALHFTAHHPACTVHV